MSLRDMQDAQWLQEAERLRKENERLRKDNRRLAREAEHLNFIVDNMPALISYVGADCRYRYANDGYLEWLGVPGREAEGRHMREVLGDPVFELIESRVQQALDGEHVTFERPVFPADETDNRTFRVMYVPDMEGEHVRGFYSLITEVTDLKRVTEAYAASEARLRTIFDYAGVGIAVVRARTGTIVEANSELESLLGYEPGELDGRRFGELTREPIGTLPDFESVFAGESSEARAEQRLSDTDDQEVWVDLRASAIPGTMDGGRMVVLMAEDITERRSLEKQLRQSQKLEAVGRLSSGVAHDFNNLLMGLIGCSTIALKKLEPSHPAHRFVEEAKSAAERGTDLTRRLQAFTRKRDSDVVTVEINAIVREARRMLARLIGEHIELVVHESDEPAWARFSPGEMHQVLLNLAVNARDAIGESGTITISVETQRLDADSSAEFGRLPPGRFILLRLSDDGCGMESETLVKAFEPFFTTKEIGSGTGLGLPSVYGAVRRHDGAVRLDSGPGVGTTVTIALPVAEPPAEFAESAEPVAPVLSGGTVLLLEDEALVRVTVRGYLEELGFDVVEAVDGQQALQLVEEGLDYRLLVSDIVLPGSPGPRVAERLDALRPGRPVLFVSAYSCETLSNDWNISPDCPSLQKPFTQQELAWRLEEILSDRELVQSRPRSVLLVEDHDASRMAVEMLLDQEGFSVESAASLGAADRLFFGAERFDVLVTDLHLPDGNGLDLLKRYRAHTSDLGVVLLSGAERGARVLEEALDSPRTRYVKKPVDFDELIDMVRHI